MKIKGIDSVREKSLFELKRKDGTVISIPLVAVLPADDIRITNEMLPPAPPSVPLLRNGKPLRGDDGRVVHETNEHDEVYQKARNEQAGLAMIAWIVAGTAWNDDFALEADAGRRDADPRAYYLRVLGELSEIGFSTGDISAWYWAIRKLTSPSREEVVAAKDRFQDEGRESD